MDHWLRVLFYVLIVRPFLTLVIGIRVKGREHLETGEQVVVVSNHNSHLDTVVLLDLIGVLRMSRFRPVAAADYFEKPGPVGYLSHVLFNILPIRRKGPGDGAANPIDAMAAAVDAGDSLILFPEGTRGEPEKLARFRSGAGVLIARYPHLKVIPVWQEGMGKILPKGAWYPVPFNGSVNIGAPMTFTGDAKQITAELEATVLELGRQCRSDRETKTS